MKEAVSPCAEEPHICIHRRDVIVDILKGLQTKGKTIIDVGCGSGRFFGDFHSLGLSIVSLDVNRHALMKSLSEVKKKGFNASLVLADARLLPLKDEMADFIMASQVLEHLIYPKDALHEVYRVLKKEKLFFMDVPWMWEILRPTSAMLLRLLMSFRKRKQLYLLKLFFKSNDPSSNMEERKIFRWLMRALKPKYKSEVASATDFLVKYLSGTLSNDSHKNFYTPYEWKLLLNNSGFACLRITGTSLLPTFIGNNLLLKLTYIIEKRMPDWLRKWISQFLLIIAKKRS